jgi:copper chaperone CopZ
MKTASFKVGKLMCAECSMALRRFIGGLDGVDSVEPGEETIDVRFDETKIAEDELRRIAKDSVEKLGYRIQDE